MPGRLGSASSYTAVIHRLGGQQTFMHVEGLEKLSWGRKLDDYSEASITVAKKDASANCCGKLGQVHTWGHELSIYRDDEFVWQGPIVNKHEFRDRFVFDARDMLAWFDRRATLGIYNWAEKTEENPGAWLPADSALIVARIVEDGFGRSGAIQDPRLDPNVLDHVVIPGASGHTATFQALQIGEKNLGASVRSVAENGLDMYTVGRSICFFPTSLAHGWTPLRLTEHDFLTDLEVRESGLDAATLGIVVGTQPQNPVTDSGTQPPPQQPAPVASWPIWNPLTHTWSPVEPFDPFYGAIIRTSSSQTATTADQCVSLAHLGVAYGNPPPIDIIVPSGANLSPDAKVTVSELIPGYPLLVNLESYCTEVTQRFVLNELEVEVDLSSGGLDETVQVSMASQGSPLTDTA